MSSKNRILLSVMMFLQFFIWGSWYVTGPNYLSTIGFKAGDFGTMYSVGPIAGMIAPFFVGMIADRFFPAQVVMGAMHLLGAAFMYYATTLMSGANPSASAINTMFFAHMMTYYPTLALTNTIAMKCMTNPEKEFPGIGLQKGEGARLYRESDVEQVLRIKQLVFGEGLTLAGVRRRLEGDVPVVPAAAPVEA